MPAPATAPSALGRVGRPHPRPARVGRRRPQIEAAANQRSSASARQRTARPGGRFPAHLVALERRLGSGSRHLDGSHKLDLRRATSARHGYAPTPHAAPKGAIGRFAHLASPGPTSGPEADKATTLKDSEVQSRIGDEPCTSSLTIKDRKGTPFAFPLNNPFRHRLRGASRQLDG